MVAHISRLAIATAVVLMMSGEAAAQVPAPQSVIAAYFDAANAYDTAAAQALVTPETVLRFAVGSPSNPDGTRFIGAEGVATRFDAAVAGNVHDEVANFEVTGDRVTFTDFHSNNAFRMLGIASLEFRGEAVVRAGKIMTLTVSYTPAALARQQAALSAPQGAPAQVPALERADPTMGDSAAALP
jgi:hypothetical protein